MIEIKEYENKYAEEISKMIIKNLIEINSKDYDTKYIQNFVADSTIPEIQKKFSKRTKVLVALENNKIVGTAGLDKSWYNNDGEYWILTVFVDYSHHKQGIGRTLIQAIEKYAREINGKKLVVPASITGCEFYYKLGYIYKDNKKELNNDQMYIMEKYL